LDGDWKFNWAPDPDSRPKDFYKTEFDVSGWDNIPVPSSWNIYGVQKDGSLKYGVPIYVNQPVIFQHKVAVAEVEKVGAAVVKAEVFSRTAFIDKYLKYNPTTVKQNEEWIAVAEKGVSSKSVFVDIENSQMKVLNDTLKDKNLVTSLTNYHKSLVVKKIEALKKEFPGLKISEYSDFKSLRFAFDGNVPKDLQQRLNKIFQSANDEFTDYLVKNKLVNSSDKADSWFRAGTGKSAEQANLVAPMTDCKSLLV
jgi:hypothetical protein